MTRGEMRDIVRRQLANTDPRRAEMITDAEINSLINQGLVEVAREIEGEMVTADLESSDGRFWLPDDFLVLKRVDQPDQETPANVVPIAELSALGLDPVQEVVPAIPANIGIGWESDFNQGYVVGDIGEKLADHALVYNDADQLYHLIHISERYFLDPAAGSSLYSGRQFGHKTSEDLRVWTTRDDVLRINYDSDEWDDMAHWAPNIHINPKGTSKYILHYTGIGGDPRAGTAARNDPEKIGVAYSNDLSEWWVEESNPVAWGGIGVGNLVAELTLPEDLRGGWGTDMVYHTPSGESYGALRDNVGAQPDISALDWAELPLGAGNPASLPEWNIATNYEVHYQFFWPWSNNWLAVTRDPSVFYDPGSKKYYLLTTAIGPANIPWEQKGFLAMYECVDADDALITWQDRALPLIEFDDHAINIESPHILPITHGALGRTYHLFWSAAPSWGTNDHVDHGGRDYICNFANFNQEPGTAGTEEIWIDDGAAPGGGPAWSNAAYYEPSGTHHQSNTALTGAWGGSLAGETAGVGKHVTGRRGETAGEATETPGGTVFSAHRIFYNGGGTGAYDRYYYRFGYLDFTGITAAGYDPSILTQHPVYSSLDAMTGIEGGWKVLVAGTIPSDAFDFQPTFGDQPSLDINRGNLPAGITGNSCINTFEGYQAPGRSVGDWASGWTGNHQLTRGPDYGYGEGDPFASCDVRGVAISEAFTITRNRFKARVAGGERVVDTADADYGKPCIVALVRRSDHMILVAETGAGAASALGGDHWTLTTRLWNTTDLVGTEVYCAIIDLCDSIGSTVLSGHIACDLIQEYGEAGEDDPTLTITTPSTVMSLQTLVAHFGYTGSLDSEF